MLYFDTSYVVRLYTRDDGWAKVRTLAASDSLACCLHGRAEVIAAFHRKFREGVITQNELTKLIAEFDRDCQAGAFDWLALSSAIVERTIKVYAGLPSTVHLRAADALHLACAAENAFKNVHSNDARFLAAATHFGLNPVNVI
jgi:predicted nucleic acid-binding protein